MKTYVGGYVTNINNMQSLSCWEIQQTQIYLLDMIQKA